MYIKIIKAYMYSYAHKSSKFSLSRDGKLVYLNVKESFIALYMLFVFECQWKHIFFFRTNLTHSLCLLIGAIEVSIATMS